MIPNERWCYGLTEWRCARVAVTADSEEPLTGRLTGVGGGQLRTARAAGLTAIVGDVSEAEFGEFTLRSNLEDLDWGGGRRGRITR